MKTTWRFLAAMICVLVLAAAAGCGGGGAPAEKKLKAFADKF